MSTFKEFDVPVLGKQSIPTGLFMQVLERPVIGWFANVCSDNEWTSSSSGETFPTVNPATGQHLADFAHATNDDVDRAVKAARKAFKTTWGNQIPATERAAGTPSDRPIHASRRRLTLDSHPPPRRPDGARHREARRFGEVSHVMTDDTPSVLIRQLEYGQGHQNSSVSWAEPFLAPMD